MHDGTIFPIGPEHPALEEIIFLELKTEANVVVSAKPKVGYLHRSIEELLIGKPIQKALFVAERICGICSHSHTQALVNTIEKLMNLEVPVKVSLQRMVIAELERIHSHLLCIGLLLHEIGLETYFMLFWKNREYILDCFEFLTGGRVHHSINAIGTVRCGDFTKEKLEKVNEYLEKVKLFIEQHRKIISTHEVIVSRFKDKGRISNAFAKNFDVVGPNGRASSYAFDIRKIDPYELYADFPLKICVRKNGCALERTLLRCDEILESIKLIQNIIETFPYHEKISEYKPKLSWNISGCAYSRAEAPRGELFYYIEAKNGIIQNIKIKTPTFHVLGLFDKILKDVPIARVPVIIQSLDPCFSCMERCLVVNEKGEKHLLKKYHQHGVKHDH